jgi:hypothetical protein
VHDDLRAEPGEGLGKVRRLYVDGCGAECCLCGRPQLSDKRLSTAQGPAGDDNTELGIAGKQPHQAATKKAVPADHQNAHVSEAQGSRT